MMKKAFFCLSGFALMGLVSCSNSFDASRFNPKNFDFSKLLPPKEEVKEVAPEPVIYPTSDPSIVGKDNRFGPFHAYGRNSY